PLGFALPDGRVTKVLADECSLAWLPVRFRVAPAYLDSVRRERGARSGLFYLNPPAGAVSLRTPSLTDLVSTVHFTPCARREVPFRDLALVAALASRLPAHGLIFEWPGRSLDPLQRQLLARGPDRAVETLALAGFDGLCVDRAALSDRGVAVTSRLDQLLP